MIKLIASGVESQDCTSSYYVNLDHEYTVKEFIEEIKASRPREFGYVGINSRRNISNVFGDPVGIYGSNIVMQEDLSSMNPVLDKTIQYVSASGGWGRMDYLITLKDEYDGIITNEKVVHFQIFRDGKEYMKSSMLLDCDNDPIEELSKFSFRSQRPLMEGDRITYKEFPYPDDGLIGGKQIEVIYHKKDMSKCKLFAGEIAGVQIDHLTGFPILIRDEYVVLANDKEDAINKLKKIKVENQVVGRITELPENPEYPVHVSSSHEFYRGYDQIECSEECSRKGTDHDEVK